MRKIMVLGLVTVGLVAGTWMFAEIGLAEGGRHAEMRGHQEKRIEHMKEVLHLTADQEAKVRAAFQTMHEKVQAIRKETHESIAALLTPEQREKFEKMKEKKHKPAN